MIDPVDGTEEFMDENSVNDVLASNYTFGEFDNQSIPQPTLYNCGNKSVNCKEEIDTEGYFYKVCNLVFENYLDRTKLKITETRDWGKRRGSILDSICLDSHKKRFYFSSNSVLNSEE